ncbi:MAG: hypothetical protein ACYCSQ_04640 [bacterium]
MDTKKTAGKKIKLLLSSAIAVFTVAVYFVGVSYGLAVPLPDIGAVSGQIQSVEAAAGGAFSALQGLAGTLGYAPGASGGPLFNPGPGLSEAMATADKLTADVSKMQEEYQNIVINYDKLSHLVNSVENAVNSVNNLNNRINSAFNQIPQDLTAGDVQISSPQSLLSDINSESMEFQNLNGINEPFNPQSFISGYSSSEGVNLSKTVLENGSSQFTEGAIFNSNGNTGIANTQLNCSSSDNGYYFDGGGNPVGGCTDLVGGFEADAASSSLYNAGVSAARAHKAELESDGFMQEISDNTLKNSTNYYAYQSSILTIMAEENAASLKNLGYMESQLKQLELAKSAEEIKKEHAGAVILPQTNSEPDMNFYSNTTM